MRLIVGHGASGYRIDGRIFVHRGESRTAADLTGSVVDQAPIVLNAALLAIDQAGVAVPIEGTAITGRPGLEHDGDRKTGGARDRTLCGINRQILLRSIGEPHNAVPV